MTFAEQLKSQLNIVDVIGQVVRLKRQGSGPRYVGLCPFHADKRPSFSVHSTLQIYKCFACDAAGDVFKFVMEKEGLTFPETLKALAERYGIPMPERERFDDPVTRQRSALLEMHEVAATLFQDNLRGSAGAEARRYLESRGVSRALMDEFRLGLSDGSGNQLAKRLQKFELALLEESGLIVKRQDGSGFFDRFRARLMFPIHNESGKLIAFAGRALRPNDEPKYLNSPETKIYKKSTVLYNLHRAKSDARKHDRMILVEGYMDVIGVYAAGIHEVVAISGTSLSLDQVRAIKRHVSESQARGGHVVLNLDPDSAGARSTEKHIGTLLAEGLRVRVLEIPGGLDPDEYIQQEGAEAYQGLLESAVSYFHWLAGRARGQFDMHTAEGRMDAFRHLAPVLQSVHDRMERATIVSEIAEYLKIDRELVRVGLHRSAEAEAQWHHERLSAVPPNEKLLVACLLSSEDARVTIREYFRCSNILHVLELRSIFEALLSLDELGIAFSLEALSNRLDQRMQAILTQVSFSDFGIREEDAAQQALHCLAALETTSLRATCDELRRRIQELEKAGNFAEALNLAQELNRIRAG